MEIPLREMFLGILPSLFPLAAWIVALVFTVRMFRNSRSKPERLLLIGASLMLVRAVARSIMQGVSPFLFPMLGTSGYDITSISLIISVINMVFGCVSLAGIICLVYAFWQKFKVSLSADVT